MRAIRTSNDGTAAVILLSAKLFIQFWRPKRRDGDFRTLALAGEVSRAFVRERR
ncbi:hypothetical protein [Methylocystis bryophila]|uniref:hypothetical protein n=1 Tax=Methylocystis bryophila TaxID=655015 RepID=UPI001319FBB0|nr:hypothetical protein [Methylocystis bryophila]